MTTPIFQVDKPGLLTSFQDLGRKNHQSKGVVASGAMDMNSCQIANLLVGNQKEEACIEVAVQGPSFTVTAKSATISICGAELSPMINGNPVEMWKTLQVKEGDKLQFGAPKSGVYAYIAVSGGFAIPKQLGSKSRYPKASLGLEIKKGDILFAESLRSAFPARGLRHDYTFPKEVEARVIRGPHESHFSVEDFKTFFSQTYQVRQGDRMGYRLQGELPLSSPTHTGIASDAIPLGGIQVPEDGQPIVLLADRQTTGGYRRIGTVITADLPKLVQVPAGGMIHFQEATLEEAYEALLEQQRFLKHVGVFIQ